MQGQAGLPVLLGAMAGGTSDTRPAGRVSEGGGPFSAAALTLRPSTVAALLPCTCMGSHG